MGVGGIVPKVAGGYEDFKVLLTSRKGLRISLSLDFYDAVLKYTEMISSIFS